MPTTDDFELTNEELRAVARFVVACATPVLPFFEDAVRGDDRPRRALDAAQQFIDGAPRGRLQRLASTAAHRAAAEAPTEVARLAARAAGDAASAAYLHPIAKAHQVGHLLRAAACAARIAELDSERDPAAAQESLAHAEALAGREVRSVLGRYPRVPLGRGRVAVLMERLDADLRATPGAEALP